MIVDFFLGLVEGVIKGVLGLIPSFSMPSWWSDGNAGGVLYDLGDKCSSLTIWVPWVLIFAVALSCIFVRLSMLVVQGGLKVYAMIRGGAS